MIRRFGEYKMDYLISPTSADYEQMSALYRSWFISNPHCHTAVDGGVQFSRCSQWIRNNHHLGGARILAIRHFDRIVAFAHFWIEQQHFPEFSGNISSRFRDRGPLAYIYLIVVDREHRNNGLGRILYQQVFEECTLNNVQTLVAEVYLAPVPNVASLLFHQAMGFNHSGYTTTHSRDLKGSKIRVIYSQMLFELAPLVETTESYGVDVSMPLTASDMLPQSS